VGLLLSDKVARNDVKKRFKNIAIARYTKLLQPTFHQVDGAGPDARMHVEAWAKHFQIDLTVLLTEYKTLRLRQVSEQSRCPQDWPA
jgi:hypothetical protein